AIEHQVNQQIRGNSDTRTRLLSPERAVEEGALALFGEKYGDEVRVIAMGRENDDDRPYSVELCGGTHVRRTGDIGVFKIVGESSIASGVRRITGLTGIGALQYVREMEHEVRRAAELLKTTPKELARRVESTQKRVKELERKV